MRFLVLLVVVLFFSPAAFSQTVYSSVKNYQVYYGSAKRNTQDWLILRKFEDRGKTYVMLVEPHDLHTKIDEIEPYTITPNGRFLIERTLRDLEALLPTETFARVHKQTIVNLEKLTVLEPIAKGGASARLKCGEIVEISRRYAQDLRQKLGW